MSCVCCVVPLREWSLSFHLNFTKHRPFLNHQNCKAKVKKTLVIKKEIHNIPPWILLGDPLKTLCGHTTSTELSSCPGNPYFVSNAVMDKEESFRVWEKASLRCLASFKLDSYVRRLYSWCICLTLSNIRIA